MQTYICLIHYLICGSLSGPATSARALIHDYLTTELSSLRWRIIGTRLICISSIRSSRYEELFDIIVLKILPHKLKELILKRASSLNGRDRIIIKNVRSKEEQFVINSLH